MKNIKVHYEIFIFDLSKMFKTMNIHFKSVAYKTLVRPQLEYRERSGSVVECLTPDRGAAGSSLTGVTALCP